MATDARMVISAETTVHDALRDFAQRIHDDYGMRIRGVTIEWLEFAVRGEQKAVVAGVEMDTMSRGRREEGGS